MTESEILFDAVDAATKAAGSLFSLLLGIGFPCVLLLFAIIVVRTSQTKGKKVIGAVLGVVALVQLAIGLSVWLTNPLAKNMQRHIDSGDYEEVQGAITNLQESSMSSSKPKATFEVAGHTFEYARGSSNYELDMAEKYGFLAEGLGVKIWFKDKKILRIYALDSSGQEGAVGQSEAEESGDQE